MGDINPKVQTFFSFSSPPFSHRPNRLKESHISSEGIHYQTPKFQARPEQDRKPNSTIPNLEPMIEQCKARTRAPMKLPHPNTSGPQPTLTLILALDANGGH